VGQSERDDSGDITVNKLKHCGKIYRRKRNALSLTKKYIKEARAKPSCLKTANEAAKREPKKKTINKHSHVKPSAWLSPPFCRSTNTRKRDRALHSFAIRGARRAQLEIVFVSPFVSPGPFALTHRSQGRILRILCSKDEGKTKERRRKTCQKARKEREKMSPKIIVLVWSLDEGFSAPLV
jgi:hypothetical protein